ncbi:peptidoglycan-binding domain-containing protein [Actinokineospora sp. NBRC 105648]|uniref:peptidoglycan-binding domain-containing protein n=1 Tax=Actinokineospora sp. NBRC 105648 TaxID=3032206 RepID=UPI0024A3D758|nr:peptidoglycan-binding domain-containing protein [Actinokineospora sp. NBRC 105648]GLZ42966.1 hypothetical protein Acsp05_65900 [Actinokineospora sp. NBRC 105648]
MADEPVLHPGTSSDWVLYLQQLLNQHYQQSVVDENGAFDEATENAVRHLRQQNGLPNDSTVDDEVWSVLTAQSSQSSQSTQASQSATTSGDGGHDGGGNNGAEGNDAGGEPAAESTDRYLTGEEATAADSVFQGTLDTGPIVLSEGGILAVGGYARTLPDHVTFPDGTLSHPPSGFMHWLMHELAHCWQYQQGASVPGLIMSALGGDYDYGGEQGLRDAVANGQPFDDFGYEEQASIIADYWQAANSGGDTSAFDPYIRTIRDGTWTQAPQQVDH